MQLRATLFGFGSFFVFACNGEPQSAGDAHDPALLESYLRAIPNEQRLVSGVPAAAEEPFALTSGPDAALAVQGIAFARAVNRPARELVQALRAVTELPPTRFDAAASRFVWGPWDNGDGVGQVALIVSRNEPSADFEYSYALLRTMDGDLASATAVIAGAATPDPEEEDRGVGVALWDIEAHRTFEQTHAGEDAETAGGGRFVMAFGHLAAEEGEALFNVAVFRDFVPANGGADAPIDVDYFYGRFVADAGVTLDFVDTVARADVCAASAESCFDEGRTPGSSERFSYNAFFVNRGLGRAEVAVSEGDLQSSVRLVECWDPALDRTSFQVENDGAMVETMPSGSCSAPADQSALELGLPTLSDIDAAMLDAMSCAAENGLIGCE